MTPNKVLAVIDDSAPDRIADQARKVGFHVPPEAVAWSHEELIGRWGKVNPDIVLVDVVMPSDSDPVYAWDGFAAVCEIAHRHSALVYAMSTTSSAENIATACRLGAVRYLHKPRAAKEVFGDLAVLFAEEGPGSSLDDVRHAVMNHPSFTLRGRRLASPTEINCFLLYARAVKAEQIGQTLHIAASTAKKAYGHVCDLLKIPTDPGRAADFVHRNHWPEGPL